MFFRIKLAVKKYLEAGLSLDTLVAAAATIVLLVGNSQKQDFFVSIMNNLSIFNPFQYFVFFSFWLIVLALVGVISNYVFDDC